MPYPKRDNPDDYFDRLEPHQRPHLDQLRAISNEYVDRVSEELRWNQPAYIADGTQWMLQAFKNHCSLRFTPAFFESWQQTVANAGYEHGAGFLKIRYDQEVPADLCRQLIDAKLSDAKLSE
ncbi:iron chaperone [Gulosibacter chungangensis]|uniref:DUF1801 domain-containing protein n=1 Tax=Gulosibacter chungangensis TaxID=979746 RepID=A0A7J5BDM2_9MICO|nr:DUF1801 domain-containing protein [Gulosibacter chungangensis]KAB1643388.1 DUF1801 domain-containing protein [Gulosibacter chungangensis]